MGKRIYIYIDLPAMHLGFDKIFCFCCFDDLELIQGSSPMVLFGTCIHPQLSCTCIHIHPQPFLLAAGTRFVGRGREGAFLRGGVGAVEGFMYIN